MIRRLVAYVTLLVSFGVTLLVSRFGAAVPRRRRSVTGRILVTGTFYNRGWFLSHAVPLARSGVMAVTHMAVFAILAATAGVVYLARLVRRVLGQRREPRSPGRLRLVVTGTFYHENWFRSHILPLSKCGAIDKIFVVTDHPLFDVDKVSYVCPTPQMLMILGRAASRFFLLMREACRCRPDVLMGYHIMPNALFCLVASSLFGGQSVYQMTGGPIQITGGGAGSENALLCRLGRHSATLEALLYRVVRLFDLVVVRGGRAAAFLKEHRLARRVMIITGSVDTERFQKGDGQKRYDLVLVGRHIKAKRPQLFVELVGELRRSMPQVRAALVGDGPLSEGLKAQAVRMGLEENVEFLGMVSGVERVLERSRIFVLTSQTEGLSIAMMEAMAAGLPIFGPDVGELADLLHDGETGVLIDPAMVPATAREVLALLQDESRLRRMSEAARATAVRCTSVAAIARKWDRCFGKTVNSADCGD